MGESQPKGKPEESSPDTFLYERRKLSGSVHEMTCR